MQIWKFELNKNAATIIKMPSGANILRVDVQRNEIQLWALVEPDAPMETRTIDVYGTGDEIQPGNLKFINTFFVAGGGYVFHAFERLPV